MNRLNMNVLISKGRRTKPRLVPARATAATFGVLVLGALLAGALLSPAPSPVAMAAPAQQAADRWPAMPVLSSSVEDSPSPVRPWSAPAAPEQGRVDIAVRDDYFDPQVVTITVGSVVRWTNLGQHNHSSTSVDGYWNWRLVPGASFGLRFLQPGTYSYDCIYHRSTGMTGTVVVTGDGPLPTPTVGPGPVPGVDDQTIVFGYFADEALRTAADLFLVQPDGSNRRPLTNTPNLDEAQPSWSPDRRRVAYTARTHAMPGAAWGLWVQDLATGQPRHITNGPEHYEPDWHPDGSLLVFTIIRRSGGLPISSEIAVISPDGAHYRPLARVASSSYRLVNPTWSPDGQRIAFSLSSGQSGGELYVMNADGSDAQRVLAHPGWNDIDPEWSPDGRYLAFSSGQITSSDGSGATRHDIWLLDLTTGLAGAVAQELEWDLRRPAWSPEGDRIVFTARFQDEPGRWALYTVPATGGTVSGPISLGVEPDWGSGGVLPQVTPPPTPTGTPPEPPTPPVFPTFPPPEPTSPGPVPTFPPPEPTPTSAGSTETATAATATPGTPMPTVTAGTTEPTATRIHFQGWLYMPIAWNP